MPLTPLSKSDPSRLHRDAFDVRGWEVRTEVDDEKAGSVNDVLIDGSGMPHLLDVQLGTFQRHVLVPLGHAWADASRKVVWVEGISRDDVKKMPEVTQKPEEITTEFEQRLSEDFTAAASGAKRRDDEREARHRLQRLAKAADFKVAKGSTDPRGWKVVGGDGSKIGKVVELILDQDDMRVRYLDVDVDESKLQLETIDRHVLVPIERARLDHKRKSVVLDGLFGADLKTYPIFSGLPLAKGVETEIESRYRGAVPPTEAWVDRSAQRFFGGGRHRPREAERVAAGDAAMARQEEGETVLRPREGEEIRIRNVDGEIIIERHAAEGDHG
jgi:hypothetical protein